jgi:general secretion pathway protein H
MLQQERGTRIEERGKRTTYLLDSQTSNLEPRASNLEPRTGFCRGFTLIELVVVVAILSLVALLVIPLLPSTDAANLRSSARRLSAVIRYLGERSVTTKSPYRMRLDLTDNTITVKQIVNGEETAPDDPFFARKLLADGVTIEDVEIPRLGKLGVGEVTIFFGGRGLEEFIIIHLKGGKENRFTVMAFPDGGKVKVLEGYQEVKL